MAAALADKLEVIAGSLEECKARWEARQLPKLQLAAHKTWRQKAALLAAWQDDQAHVQVIAARTCLYPPAKLPLQVLPVTLKT